MKKTILFAMSMAFANLYNAQDNGGYDLTSVIKPSQSRGYICWNAIPDVKYQINLLQKDSLGNYYSVGTKSTTNNYARLEKSNYSDESGLYYSINAYSVSNGSTIYQGDVQVYLPVGAGFSNPICEVDCNGSNYAWNMELREDVNTLILL